MTVTDHFEARADEVTLAAGVLNTEQTLKLFCKGQLLHSFVCSPAQLGELCAGWLISEGYRAASVTVDPEGNAVAEAVTPIPPQKLCSREHATQEEMLALFRQASNKYERSHGIHECVIKGENWHIIRTDIGRHNAMDKALGAAHLAGFNLTGATMFISGRINVQTVKKAARCGIGCLMSKAVITYEALQLAEELGLPILYSVKG